MANLIAPIPGECCALCGHKRPKARASDEPRELIRTFAPVVAPADLPDGARREYYKAHSVAGDIAFYLPGARTAEIAAGWIALGNAIHGRKETTADRKEAARLRSLTRVAMDQEARRAAREMQAA